MLHNLKPILGSSDGSSTKNLIPSLEYWAWAEPEPRPFTKVRSRALMILYFLLHKSPNFLGPSPKMDPEPGSSLGPSQNFEPEPGLGRARARPGLGPITTWELRIRCLESKDIQTFFTSGSTALKRIPHIWRRLSAKKSTATSIRVAHSYNYTTFCRKMPGRVVKEKNIVKDWVRGLTYFWKLQQKIFFCFSITGQVSKY